jgi:uncharacterized membrane protein YbhN (UPF0104 family)
LPSNVGGDAVKLFYLRRMGASGWGGPFALLLLHRVSGMIVLLLATALYVTLAHDRFLAMLRAARVDARIPFSPWWLLLVMAVAISVAIAWLTLSGRHREKLVSALRRFASECAAALASVGPRASVLLVLLTLAFHFLLIAGFYVLVQYAGQHIELLDCLIVLSATALAAVIPITVGGLGLMEGAPCCSMVCPRAPGSWSPSPTARCCWRVPGWAVSST